MISWSGQLPVPLGNRSDLDARGSCVIVCPAFPVTAVEACVCVRVGVGGRKAGGDGEGAAQDRVKKPDILSRTRKFIGVSMARLVSVSESATLPDLSHLTYRDYEHVYEPAGDTYLLADALWSERHSLRDRMCSGTSGVVKSILGVEIGSGTATATAVLSQCFVDVGLAQSAKFICTDVNPHAAAASKETLNRNGVIGDIILTDLVQAIRPQIDGKVDVLIFNPPYVPTPSEEVGGNGISAAWAGGCKGREVLDRINCPRW